LLNVEDWAEIRRLYFAEKVPIKEIARRLALARNTVRAAIRSAAPPKYKRAARGSFVDAAEPDIRRLLRAHPRMPASVIVARLAEAHGAGRLQSELVRLGRYPLLVIDEVGSIPFEPEAANLFFQLLSSRYERASVIVTSNKPFGRWGEVFGDAPVAAAMIDRLVHHAEIVSLKGDSYRLKDRDLGRVPTDDPA
jgi:hypothetical protein